MYRNICKYLLTPPPSSTNNSYGKITYVYLSNILLCSLSKVHPSYQNVSIYAGSMVVLIIHNLIEYYNFGNGVVLWLLRSFMQYRMKCKQGRSTSSGSVSRLVRELAKKVSSLARTFKKTQLPSSLMAVKYKFIWGVKYKTPSHIAKSSS